MWVLESHDPAVGPAGRRPGEVCGLQRVGGPRAQTGHQGVLRVADYSAALREQRVCRRLRHHHQHEPDGRACRAPGLCPRLDSSGARQGEQVGLPACIYTAVEPAALYRNTPLFHISTPFLTFTFYTAPRVPRRLRFRETDRPPATPLDESSRDRDRHADRLCKLDLRPPLMRNRNKGARPPSCLLMKGDACNSIGITKLHIQLDWIL